MFGPLTKITCLAAGLLVCAGASFAAALGDGDVFASVGNGKVNEYTQAGVFVQQLDTTHAGAFTTGSGFFGLNGNFYVTDFNANAVTQFSGATGALVGDFGSGYNADPESILFDGGSHVWVGQADGTHHLLEFNSSGTLLNTFAPATQDRGTDWIDLASDQHTMFYTSEGNAIMRFDTATSTQLSNFNSVAMTGAAAYALRITGNGDVLVADSSAVDLFNSSGTLIKTYTPGDSAGGLFSLNLDPDGTSFWTGDFNNGRLWKIDIASGTILEDFSTGSSELFGVSVKGEITVSQTPEPSQLVMSMVLVGLLAAVGYWRKRKAAEIV